VTTDTPHNAADADIVLGPRSDMDLSVTMIPRSINPTKSRAPLDLPKEGVVHPFPSVHY